MPSVNILQGDVIAKLKGLAAGSYHCVVTSPPYWGLRDYGVEGQLGLEKLHDCLGWATGHRCGECYICRMTAVFMEVHRVLRDDGTLFLNIGDSYASAWACNRRNIVGNGAPKMEERVRKTNPGLKEKDLCMIPWRLALALQADGWWIRSVIVWHKRSPMPENVTDRPTSSWEPIFLLSKSAKYYYDHVAVQQKAVTKPHRSGYVDGAAYAVGPMDRGGHSQREDPDRVWAASGTANLRNVWTLSSEPVKEKHFACFPSEIPHRAIAAGTSERGCCPTCGAPWVRIVEKGEVSYSDGGDRKRADAPGAVLSESSVFRTGEITSVRTLGWKPTCDHGGEPIPCTVLDPFGGSGTTGLEASRMGRNSIMCELNPEYVAIMRKRMERNVPLFADLALRDSQGTGGRRGQANGMSLA